jgi:TRAP-type C4-dicarboxylate transport system substrate-binding protein
MKYLAKFFTMILALGAVMLPGQASAEKVMRVGSWLPPKHTMNKDVLPTWGKWISEATEGRVTLKIEYPGGHPKAMLGNVQDGVFDAAWTFHGYFPGRFKLTKIVELPGLGAGAEAASVAHWRINKKYLHKAGEHKGIILGALFTHGPGQIHLREPIASLKEMDGKKIRIGGGVQTDIANRMGVKGVAAPGSKVYEILSQGVADGVFMPMGEKRTLRLKEVAPFTMKFPTGMYLGSFGVFLNKDFLDSLSAQDRTAVVGAGRSLLG